MPAPCTGAENGHPPSACRAGSTCGSAVTINWTLGPHNHKDRAGFSPIARSAGRDVTSEDEALQLRDRDPRIRNLNFLFKAYRPSCW
jgi:hypothetical protein